MIGADDISGGPEKPNHNRIIHSGRHPLAVFSLLLVSLIRTDIGAHGMLILSP
jgi:hypothetical protein